MKISLRCKHLYFIITLCIIFVVFGCLSGGSSSESSSKQNPNSQGPNGNNGNGSSDDDSNNDNGTNCDKGYLVGNGIWAFDEKGWQNVTPPILTQPIIFHALSFIACDHLIAAGFDPQAKASQVLEFKGSTWTPVQLPSVDGQLELFALAVIDNQNWFSAGSIGNKESAAGIIIENKEGTWIIHIMPSVSKNWNIVDLFFPDLDHGMAVGFDAENQKGVILSYQNSSDVQSSWALQELPDLLNGISLYGIKIDVDGNAIVVGTDLINFQGAVLINKDGKWSKFDVPPISTDWALTGTDLFDINNGIAIGIDYKSKRGIITDLHDSTMFPISPPLVSEDWMLSDVIFTKSLDSEKPNAFACGYDRENSAGILLSRTAGYWTLSQQLPDFKPERVVFR